MKKNINKTEKNEHENLVYMCDELYTSLDELLSDKDEVIWQPTLHKGMEGTSFDSLMARHENENAYVPVAVIKHDGFPEIVFYNFYTGWARYLVPFRGYCFQVCGSSDGQNDCGSNEVVGLVNVLNADYGRAIDTGLRYGTQSNLTLEKIGKNMLRNMAEACIAQAMWQSGCMFHKLPGYFDENGMSVFIDLTVDYLNNRR